MARKNEEGIMKVSYCCLFFAKNKDIIEKNNLKEFFNNQYYNVTTYSYTDEAVLKLWYTEDPEWQRQSTQYNTAATLFKQYIKNSDNDKDFTFIYMVLDENHHCIDAMLRGEFVKEGIDEISLELTEEDVEYKALVKMLGYYYREMKNCADK